MFGDPFYFSLIRKYVILVGTLFNNIRITRTDEQGNVVALLKVPITYSAKDKMLARVIQNPDLDSPMAAPPLPIISFEMGKMSYDQERKLNTVGRVSVKDNSNNSRVKYQYNPVPYNIDFKVLVYAKNTEDGTKIIEQILPYFTPDWTSTVNLIPEMDVKVDIPIILRNISMTDNYDGAFTERRAIIWELDLTLKGYLYGPVRKGGIIKFMNLNFYIPDVPDGKIKDAIGLTPIAEKVTVQPGLTANGQPTTDIEKTVPYNQIEIDDDYDFVIQIYNNSEIDQ